MSFLYSWHPATLALLSALFAAIANILARTLLKNAKSQDMLGISFSMMAVTLIVISPFFYAFTMNPLSVGLIITIVLIDLIANYYYFKIFEQTEASVATPLLSLAPAFTFFFGFLFLGERVGILSYLLAFFIIALVIFFSADVKQLSQFRQSTLLPGLCSSLLFGISAIPSKYLLDNLHAINAPTLYMLRAILIGIFALVFYKFPLRRFTITQYKAIYIRSLFVIAQWLLLYYALTRGKAGVTITLANITPIFVFILSVLFLKEPATLKKSVTALLIVILSLLIR